MKTWERWALSLAVVGLLVGGLLVKEVRCYVGLDKCTDQSHPGGAAAEATPPVGDPIRGPRPEGDDGKPTTKLEPPAPAPPLTTPVQPRTTSDKHPRDSQGVRLAVLLEGDVDLLRPTLEGRLSLPNAIDLPPGVTIEQELIVSLHVRVLPPIYEQPRASVTLRWRRVDLRSYTQSGSGAVEDLVANGPDQAAATTRAIRIAVDTMIARIRRTGLVDE